MLIYVFVIVRAFVSTRLCWNVGRVSFHYRSSCWFSVGCQNIYQNSLVLCAVLRNVWGPLAPNPSMSRYHMWQLSPFLEIEINTNNSRGNCSAWDEVLHSKIDFWRTPRNLTSSLKPPNVKAPSQCVHVPSGVLRHAEVIRSLRSKIGARPIFASFGIIL